MYDIYTPAGSPVTTWLMCEDSYEIRLSFDVDYTNRYPNAQKIITYDGLSSTQKFNCHGYAWLRVEQGIDRWIGLSVTTEEDIYMSDGSYTPVSQETYPGKVSWGSGDHSAVTTNQSGVFISKWNKWPLMKHQWNYNPFGSNNLKYYKLTPPAITGPSMVGGTTNGSYTVNVIPVNTTLTWLYDTGLLTLVSSSAKGIVVKPKTATTVGDATITARFTHTNGEIQNVYRYVGVNGPHFNDVKLIVTKSSDGAQVYPYGGLCPYTYYYARLETNASLSNVNWGASPQLEVLSASDYQLHFRALSDGWGILNISAKTSYGVTKPIMGVTLIASSDCPNTYYSIRSVPSSNIIEIKFDMEAFNGGINEKYYTQKTPFDVRIYNSITGSVMKQVRSTGESIQIDVSDIPNGIYIVQIYDGINSTPQTQKITIKH